MHAIIAIVCLLLVTSCAGRSATRPARATKQPVLVKGTYMPGSNVTEPRPRASQFFQVDHAGFVVLESGAAYYLNARVLKAPAGTNYIRVEYENPKDKSKPFVNDMELTADTKTVRFSSPDVVSGIRNYQDYTIRVTVFSKREDAQPIDTLVQPVRAYVDTTTGQVRIYDRMQPK